MSKKIKEIRNCVLWNTKTRQKLDVSKCISDAVSEKEMTVTEQEQGNRWFMRQGSDLRWIHKDKI